MRGAIKVKLLTAANAVVLMLVQFALPSPVFAQTGTAAVGFVKALTPPVFIKKGAGPLVPAKVGDILASGTTVVTGAGGKADLLFADGQQVVLGKYSTFRIEDYRFDPANPGAGRANFGLVSGSMSVVTGAIHTQNPGGLRFSAGTGVISILSKDVTAFVVEADPEEKQRPGWAAVTVGAISIQTPSGKISQIAADQFARWRDESSLISAQPLAAAPAVIQALVMASRATVGETSLPVDVQTAAVQAAQMLNQSSGQGLPSNVITSALSGRLNMVTGDVQIRSASGVQSHARVGDTFGPGTTFMTASKGEVGLLFSEGHYVALAENSVLRIADRPADSPTDQPGSASLGLTAGRLSLVTWASFGERPAMLSVAVGNAMVSVLSKGVVAYVVEVDSETKDAGWAAVTAGSISVKTPTGPPLAVSPDKYTSWKPDEPPAPVQALSGAPSALQLAFADTILAAPGSAEVAAELASLPPTAAGPGTPPAATPPVALAPVIVPPVSPGGGGGCTGSPC